MRVVASPSEIGRLLRPLARAFDAAWQRMHWWVGVMALLYLASGVTVVKQDEVAVILRWGRLVGPTPALQQHGPGLLFAFPRPVDEVVRVQVKTVRELRVTALMSTATTLDPVSTGYALTGDQNIVTAEMVARYQVRDPAEWALYGPARSDDVLRVETAAAMVRSLGAMGVDRVLSDGRKDLIASASKRVQQGLDAAHAGIELTSLELTNLAAPAALASDFDAVQTAFIGAETKKKEAQGFAESAIPQAQSDADGDLQAARGAAAADLAKAKGEGRAFVALAEQYRASPVVARERLYRDAVDKALALAKVRWVPPPPRGGRYENLRIQLAGHSGSPPSTVATKPQPSPE